MSDTRIRVLLRAVAVVIAVLGAIDPAASVARSPKPALIVLHAAIDASSADASLRAALPDWTIESRAIEQGGVPCAVDERCILIADGSVSPELPNDLKVPLALLDVREVASSNVAVTSVVIPQTHIAAAGIARVELTGAGVAGEQTTVRIADGGTVIGSATVTWSNETSTSVDVPWWPVEAGARTLTIEAVPAANEKVTTDNTMQAGVPVGRERLDVMVFDARPSWASTFVRRALEDDVRFRVRHQSRIAPGLTAGTRGARLDAASLDEMPALIIGAPDALTDADVAGIERFVRVRGGSVVLLPEQRPAGPSARWFGDTWREHLVSTPQAIGALRASEILRSDRIEATDAVLASAGTMPVIVNRSSGEGRIIISGAMDAWRYRDADQAAFDRFWRSLVANAAHAGAPLMLTFDDSLTVPGSRVGFNLRLRSSNAPAVVEASAVSRCNDATAVPIRLWPAGSLGEFSGTLPAEQSGQCVVEVALAGQQVSGAVAVSPSPRRGVERTLDLLARQVRAAGGEVTRAGDESALAAVLGAQSATQTIDDTVYPMRSPWWMLPFAACLGAEWWLRRRAGLR